MWKFLIVFTTCFVFCIGTLNAFDGLNVGIEHNDIVTMEKFQHSGKAIPAKTYILDLDLPPKQRWNEIGKHFDPNYLINGLNKILTTEFPYKKLLPLVQKIAGDLDNFISQPYSDEIRGMSETFNVPLGDVVLINLIYDFSAYGSKACTSIVTHNEKGEIIQGRNLDYDAPEFLKNITMQLNFQKNGKTLFMATSYVGYVGIITGTKPGVFSISGDERDKGSLLKNVVSALEEDKIAFFSERQILEQATSYADALHYLMTTPTIGPLYYIIGGLKPNEAAIVVRNSDTLANVTYLGADPTHPWYIVETNYDPWNKPPASDDRRDIAIKAMNNVGESNMSADNLYKVLSTPIVLNPTTTYTTIMSAADSSIYHTMIRYDD